MYQQNYEINQDNFDRHTPDSEGLGSSIAASPAPSSDDSNLISPIPQHNYFSTPYQSNYQNYYPANQYNNYNYYNYNTNSFNDSNYYSRNNSLNYQYYNDCMNESIAYKPEPNVIQTKPVEKKVQLKFSIDSILGLNSECKIESPKEIISNPVEKIETENLHFETKSNCSKKRKSRKSSDLNTANNKRMRTIFTQEQLDNLEVEFLRQQYMVGSERSYLASSLGLSESQVKIWFQNRRIKWRKSQTGSGSGVDKQDDDYLNQSCSNESFKE
ncbi:unnamed protein product [Brachionus calyciflorus]|uniref:Homeobox domain-containing protein n=1 Tax=Brachionus calyciflorus TaxID=104777 RepID=A0A813WK23_9BILA|nr:unnamed protein product [Brachionus calyciflorus]